MVETPHKAALFPANDVARADKLPITITALRAIEEGSHERVICRAPGSDR